MDQTPLTKKKLDLAFSMIGFTQQDLEDITALSEFFSKAGDAREAISALVSPKGETFSGIPIPQAIEILSQNLKKKRGKGKKEKKHKRAHRPTSETVRGEFIEILLATAAKEGWTNERDISKKTIEVLERAVEKRGLTFVSGEPLSPDWIYRTARSLVSRKNDGNLTDAAGELPMPKNAEPPLDVTLNGKGVVVKKQVKPIDYFQSKLAAELPGLKFYSPTQLGRFMKGFFRSRTGFNPNTIIRTDLPGNRGKKVDVCVYDANEHEDLIRAGFAEFLSQKQNNKTTDLFDRG
jgi:hypothetical protein